ncbi:MAG: GtrA family protein [Lachnospiraceae bacterium]|nr:GtrA family protein [Lachnospiraceae bacterium]
MAEFLKKHRHIIFYLIFGVLTTAVNFVVYYICARLLNIDTVPSTIIAWVAAVLFAYITNRKWVFESQVTTRKGILIEIAMFFLFRLATGILDTVIMYITVDVWAFNELIMKIISNIIVIILNYVFSKLLIFRKRKN